MRYLPVAATARMASVAMMALRTRPLRRRSRSARRKMSSEERPSRPATTLARARLLPSASSRASAASSSTFLLPMRPLASSLNLSAGGKHSSSGSPGLPPTISGITGRSGGRDLKSLIFSLTYWLLAAAGEQVTISAAEPSRAARVWSLKVCPAVKSSRSRKTGRSVLGTVPVAVFRPARSLSMAKLSSPRCSHLAQDVSAWL